MLLYTLDRLVSYYRYIQAMRLMNEEGLIIPDAKYFETFKEKHYTGHKKCPTSMAWNTTGNFLVTAENTVKTWHFSEEHGLDKGSQIKTHETNIEWVEFGTANLLGTLSKDTLKFWDVRQNGKLNSLKIEKKNKSDYIRFAFNHCENGQGIQIAVLLKDSTVLIYDYKNTSTPLFTIPPKSNSNLEYFAASWDRSNSVLFLVGGESSSGSISLFSAQNCESLADPFVTHCSRITDISFASNNQTFATASEDSIVEVLTIPDIICQRVFDNKNDSAYRRVSMSCDGKYVAASSQANFIDIFNAEKGGCSWRIKCSMSQDVVAWHPKRMVLAYLDQEDKRRSLDRGDESYVHLFCH